MRRTKAWNLILVGAAIALVCGIGAIAFCTGHLPKGPAHPMLGSLMGMGLVAVGCEQLRGR